MFSDLGPGKYSSLGGVVWQGVFRVPTFVGFFVKQERNQQKLAL
jgi:hypothetical protein